MKKIYIIFKTQLLLALVLLGATMSFAQTVTVPSNCIVVTTNTTLGGILGPGGKVTADGVGTMPDALGVAPFTTNQGGLFTFTGPAGVTLGTVIKWKLIGDLSTATTTPNYSSPVQPADGTSATIKSYNKLLRLSEGIAPSSSSWGRSKGAVTVSYTTNQLLCPNVYIGGSLSFTIYKTYAPLPNATNPTNVPTIVGPSCLLPGTVYTYSVDQIASDNATDNFGFDNYYWTATAAGVSYTFDPVTTYYSADKSSITFKTPSLLPSNIILKCCYGRANPFDGNAAATPTTCVTKRLVPEVSPPKVILSCVRVGDNGFSATVDSGYVATFPGYTYQWATVGSNWTLTNPTSPSLTGTLPVTDNNPCILTLTVSNGICLPAKVYTYTVYREFNSSLEVNSYPSAGNTTCLVPNATTATSLQYSLPSSGLDNPTKWTITPSNVNGLSISNANVTGSIVNVSMPNINNAVPGSYTLSAVPDPAFSTCVGRTEIVLNIKPKAPTGVTGPTCVQRNGGSAVTYSCNVSVGATGYTWSLPTGWTTTAANNTTTLPSISVTPGGTAASASISVKANVNSCQSDPSTAFAVNYNAVAPTSLALGSCITSNFPAGISTISFANPQNFGNYTLTSTPAGLIGTLAPLLSINSVTGVGTFTFPVTGVPNTYTITLTHNTGPAASPSLPCGTAATISTSFTVTPAPTTVSWAVNYPQYDPSTGGCDNYRVVVTPVLTAPAAYTYAWFINPSLNSTLTAPIALTNSTFVTISPSGNQLQLCGASLPAGNVYCVVTPPTGSGCPVAINAVAGTHGTSRLIGTNSQENIKNFIDGISIYPNPTTGTFFIKVMNFKVSATATVIDVTGKIIGVYKLKKGENKLQNEKIATGTYAIQLEIDGKTETRKLLVN